MFQSHRFASLQSIPTLARLELARSNASVISRGEPHRAAVAAVQSAISDLNSRYLSDSEIDGYFGPRTTAAVEAFQRDYGLVVDGIVGAQTLQALDNLFCEPTVRTPRGISLHIGLNYVDSGHYGGSLELSGCDNDAMELCKVAESIGYSSTILVNEQATSLNVLASIKAASKQLQAGDSLFITYSGHGSQIPNVSLDDEGDGLDETLVLYDRMLIDDEINNALLQLSPGVRVHIVFDCCHSASSMKAFRGFTLPALNDLVASYEERLKRADFPEGTFYQGIASVTALSDWLNGAAPKFSSHLRVAAIDADLAWLFGEEDCCSASARAKNLSAGDANDIFLANEMLYKSIANSVSSSSVERPECSVVSLSACLDNEEAPSGTIMSPFSRSIVRLLSQGWGQQSYADFFKALKANSDRCTPVITYNGSPSVSGRAYERPFII
jgi:hypothetical protein